MELLVTQFVSHATKVLRLKASLKDNRIQNEDFLYKFLYVYYILRLWNFASNVELMFYASSPILFLKSRQSPPPPSTCMGRLFYI